MNKDQKRAISRTSGIVEDLLVVTIGDCVLFVGRHDIRMFCVCVDKKSEAVFGCLRLRTYGYIAVLLWADLKYGRTAAARHPFVRTPWHVVISPHSGVLHEQRVTQLAFCADYGTIEIDKECFARLRYERRILTHAILPDGWT